MKILIVDDESSILTLLGAALGAGGAYDCVTAGSGAEALERIAESETAFDCFLLDIQMPGMDGVELCRRIRSDSDNWGTPIIMLTAMSQMSYVDAAFRAGATDYVTKPFDFAELRKRIKAAISAEADSVPALEPAAAIMAPGIETAGSPFASDGFRNEVQIDFPEIDRVIGARQMHNYLRQTAISKSDHTSAFAVTLLDGPSFLAPLSTASFLAFLSKLAWSLSDATKETGALITYRGRGTFICVESGVRMSKLDLLEAQVQARIETAVAPDLKPRIVVGNRVRQTLANEGDAVDFLYRTENSNNFTLLNGSPKQDEDSERPRGLAGFLLRRLTRPAARTV